METVRSRFFPPSRTLISRWFYPAEQNDTPSVVTLSYDAENIQIAGNPDITVDNNSIQFSVDGKKSFKTEVTGLNSALFFDGLTIENKNAYIVYTADAGFLLAKSTDKTNIDIILLNDIEVDNNLYISVPTLNIGKDLILELLYDKRQKRQAENGTRLGF